MATARLSRLCTALPSIENLTVNTTSCIRRNAASRQHCSSNTYRASSLRSRFNFPIRSFSASARGASDNVEPLQQQHEARQRREETFQTSIAHNFETTPGSPSTNPSMSDRNSSLSWLSADHPVPPTTVSLPIKTYTGRVIRTHTMRKTVAVSTPRQYFDKFLQKHYTRSLKTLVHDPNKILVEGDVISYGLFEPETRKERREKGKGKRVRYVVKSVITPFGLPLDQRVPKGTET